MSKRICKNCGSLDIRTTKYSHGGKCYVCNDCSRVGLSDVFPEYIVFHKITASPEVLAPKFVYYTVNRDQFGTYYWYCSALIPREKWSEEAEAIAATLAKLKEVAE